MTRKRRRSERRAWSAAEDALLLELWPRTRTDAMPELLGRSHSSIRNRVTALHLRKNSDVSMRRPWTGEEDARLRALYGNNDTIEVAERLGRTVSAVYGRVNVLGLEKDPGFISTTGRRHAESPKARAHRFSKGHVPANKGLRRPGYAPGRMAETQFKKGGATRWMPIGSERLVGGYRYTKVTDIRNVPWTRNWVATHILLWEKHHGPLNRKTHALRFKNGDRTDVRLENLVLITRRENMLRNSLHNLPAPLPQTIQLLGALKRKIDRRTRNEEQNRRSA